MLERKIGTSDWAKRVNLSIIGMIVVDAWLIYKGIRGFGMPGIKGEEDQKLFYTLLAEELIDNTFDQVGARRRSQGSTPPSAGLVASAPRSGLHMHLTPTKRKRDQMSKALLQHKCRICKKKSKYLCSQCLDGNDDNGSTEVWLCHSETGRDCFLQHLQAAHNVELV